MQRLQCAGIGQFRENALSMMKAILYLLERNGDPNYADSWHDIAGYAKLVEDRISK